MPTLPPYHRPLQINAPRHTACDENKAAKQRQNKRYYNTWDTAWLKLRAYVLKREPLCRACKDENPPRYTAATHVDHIDGDASTFESNRLENLQPLCASHHSIKTAKENGGFGNGLGGGI